jgi:septum formation protein
MKIILASASPRRHELLKLVGLDPEVRIPEIDEDMQAGEPIEQYLERVTISKSMNVYRKQFFSSLVVSADTVVLIDGRFMGKPRDRQDAGAMLRQLSGRSHEVWTGIAIMHRGETRFRLAQTQVIFKALNEREIEYYLDHEEYMDKAGAYAVQGRAAIFVERIEGCFFNVMGFPLNLFYTMTGNLGIRLFSES